LATKNTLLESEMVEKKNSILQMLELRYYNHLKQKFKNSEKDEKYRQLKQLKFEYLVFQRAKELLKEENTAIEIQEKEIQKLISKKISNRIQEMKDL
jgi:hypothetical protein